MEGTSAVPVLDENKPTGVVRILVPLNRGLSVSGSIPYAVIFVYFS